MANRLLPFSAVARSPITRAELAHQRRSLKQARWRHWLGMAVYLFALAIAMILFWGEVAGAVLQRDTAPIQYGLRSLIAPMAMITPGLYLLRLLETLTRAANSLTREKMNGTWDLLLLTGADARQLVYGKWWATLRTMLPVLLPVIFLYAGMAAYNGSISSRGFVQFSGGAGWPLELIPPSPLQLLMIVPVVACFTVAGTALVAALGVLTSVLSTRPFTALITGAGLGLGLVAITGLGIVLTYRVAVDRMQDEPPEVQYLVFSHLNHILPSFVDQGLTVSSALANYSMRYPSGSLEEAYAINSVVYRSRKLLSVGAGFFLGLGYMTSIAWACLRLALRFTARAGAMPANAAHRPLPRSR